MPLEPLICRSRYGNVKKSYKDQREFGESKKTHTFVVSKKTRVLTVPYGTIKSKKIMAATNWTIIKREKVTNQIEIYNLDKKWTYKTALGIATELNNNEIYELVCIIETNKIIVKNDKKEEKKTDI